MAAKRDRWIVCEEHAAGPYTAVQAVRHLAAIQSQAAAGKRNVCRLEHEIVVSVTRPVTAAERRRAEIEAAEGRES